MSKIVKNKRSVYGLEEEKLRIFLRGIPVSINNLYGDPFIRAQTEDTFYKLSQLRKADHKGPISIITKSNFNDEVMNRLSEYQDMKNLIFFYSLTGFNEGGVPFEQRINGRYPFLRHTLPFQLYFEL